MEKFKVQCNLLKGAIYLMEKDFIECIEQAEMKNGMSLIIEGNGLKREETKKDLDVLEKQNLDLEQEREKLMS